MANEAKKEAARERRRAGGRYTYETDEVWDEGLEEEMEEIMEYEERRRMDEDPDWKPSKPGGMVKPKVAVVGSDEEPDDDPSDDDLIGNVQRLGKRKPKKGQTDKKDRKDKRRSEDDDGGPGPKKGKPSGDDDDGANDDLYI